MPGLYLSTPSTIIGDQGSQNACWSEMMEPVFPLEIWTIVDQYIPWRSRLILAATCKAIRLLLPPKFECVTLTLMDSSIESVHIANQLLLHKIDFLTSPHIAPSIKVCRLNFHTQRSPALPATPEVCTPLFSALAKFDKLTDLDCFRILFDERHVSVINSLCHLTRAEFTECQWMYRHNIPFENRMQLQHLLVNHGPNRHRYNWLFNTHPDRLKSLVLSSGMPAGFISGFLPPLPNLESLEINGIAMLHPEFPVFVTLCPGLIELRVTTDSLFPSFARAAKGVIDVIPSASIPDLRIYEGPAKFLPSLTRGRLVTHVGVYACPLLMKTFTMNVGSAFKKRQIRSLKIRVPTVTGQVIALLSYFKAILAVEIVVTNEDQPAEARQTYMDVLIALDKSAFSPPLKLEYLSIAEENTVWGVPRESPWYSYQRECQQKLSLPAPSPSSPTSEGRLCTHTIPDSPFIAKCANLRYVMLSDDSGLIACWNPRTMTCCEEIQSFRQWQRRRLRLFDPIPYESL
ncbi:hypothetical protein D9756_007877 [Leucocoprinus leucothites]|uniref:F-box domain-containing protein n=1 Tax=Leucocoprinus leucothites TaxID=201217 RepID=A0A8H5D4R6_9AGAR|nr:hypothetical protein D9756_007877 [Leucoagaricus leucothites]